MQPGDSVHRQLDRLAGCFRFSVEVLADRGDSRPPDWSCFERAVLALEAGGRPVPPGLAALRGCGEGSPPKLTDGSAVSLRVAEEQRDVLAGGREEYSLVWRFSAAGHPETASAEFTWAIGGRAE
jgi:hypothetical protein